MLITGLVNVPNFDKLQEKKNTLMQEYSLNKEQFSDLVQYRKNYENYYGKAAAFLCIIHIF